MDHLVFLEIMIIFLLESNGKERREGDKMNRKVVPIFVILFLAMGLSTVMAAEVREGVDVKGVPVITQSFASKEIRPGETWKVYLNVSDPDGILKNIFAVVYQAGAGPYPLSIIRIQGDNQKELSGYIYLTTSNPYTSFGFVPLKLTVEVQDKAGRFSGPVVFPLFMHGRAIQEAPPEGVFKEQDLGPIMVTLRGIVGGGGGGKGK
jgi:hypothetical protein